MKNTLYLLAVSIALISSACSRPVRHTDYNIIPLPLKVEVQQNVEFVLNKQTTISYDGSAEELKSVAAFLTEYIEQATGYKPAHNAGEENRNFISLSINEDIIHPEGYKITINNQSIRIEGGSMPGLFYGVQALRKSIPAKGAGNVVFAGVTIDDYPRFAYRGMMLDVSRHFYPVDFVKRYIDILSLHNINKFHLHLTEDQGWRIEIKSFPKLTETGSMREETIKGFITGEYDGVPHGGYYTQDELRDIVKYAQERYIEVIPEVDLPGHMLAALASYPELGCTGGPYKVATKWGIHPDVLCAGNEKTYEFLEKVFTEILDIFPSQYIHIGGDECPKTRWKECPKCQAKIKELGLKDDNNYTKESKLQSHLATMIEKFINSKGRKIIGWDEIIEGGLAPNATVMSWRGLDGGRFAAQTGHDVIMAPNSNLYFDYYQTDNTATEPAAFPEVNSIEEVYTFDPVPEGLPKEKRKHIIGVQANLWVEQISKESHVEYMTLPRLAALAELQWTQNDRKDFHNFLDRLQNFIPIYEKQGYNFAVVAYEPDGQIIEDKENGIVSLSLSTYDDAPIYYTLDGSLPTTKSERYTEPIRLQGNGKLQASAIRGNKLTDGNLHVQEFNINKATLKKVQMLTETSKYFDPPKGAELLVDGVRGNGCHVFGRTTSWIGFGSKMSAVIDLGSVQDVNAVTTSVLLVPNVKGVEYTVLLSEDGEQFTQVFTKHMEFNAIADLRANTEQQKGRYVKIEIAADNYAHVLSDEIIVE